MEEILKLSDPSVASSCVDIMDGALKLNDVFGEKGVSVKDGRVDEYISGVWAVASVHKLSETSTGKRGPLDGVHHCPYAACA
jgi:hypothetical protein